ncbi:hypothetical protein PTTG_25365 [Puccinia triticina 1-1 BBBD Race 1]|uniref:Cyanovirin-N domain-containing protein n=2 Tax=Puccinia triticina TaxID=208348 RepID=A0A180H307_PUCT1|nr:uncharacterized protein PtA15_8A661 [Puccinia triticina]OAV99397.1 hypothetical protein PTTG_25365 [Puccinia triticina 1-1 BBBD Race 1]WAQ87755.1 hypothetical protein PtA15_8A661 [Puccinia triticina]WAR57634.1 hypothetical protein PtB15_8B687 [Puccinia triticina]
MRFTIAAALFLALLNSVSANLLGGVLQPVSLLPVPSIFGQQNGGVSCGNQGNAALNANILTQVQCSGGYNAPQISCGNQGHAVANLNVLTSIDCVSQ